MHSRLGCFCIYRISAGTRGLHLTRRHIDQSFVEAWIGSNAQQTAARGDPPTKVGTETQSQVSEGQKRILPNLKRSCGIPRNPTPHG